MSFQPETPAGTPARTGWLRGLYAWVMRHAAGPHAERFLALVSFAESSFFPLPPDVLLIPMVLANRHRALRLTVICTLASVAGGVLGYAIGALFFASIGQWLIQLYGLGGGFAQFHDWYARYGAWVILIKGATPIPFKLVTIASGVALYNFPLFVLLCAITRGARFGLVAALLYRYGEPARVFIEKRLEWVMLAFLAVALAGVAAVHYLF